MSQLNNKMFVTIGLNLILFFLLAHFEVSEMNTFQLITYLLLLLFIIVYNLNMLFLEFKKVYLK